MESQKVLPAASPWCLPSFSCDTCAARVFKSRARKHLPDYPKLLP